MSKPTVLPRWGTDLSNVVTPSSGQQDTGWIDGQDGISSYDNWRAVNTYYWLKWLDDGCPGLLTVDGLAVTGGVAFTGVANVALSANTNDLNPGTIASTHTIKVTASASTWSITGLVAGANGQEIEIINVGTDYFKLVDQLSSSSASANTFKFPGNYILVSTSIIVESGGSVKLRYDTTLNYWIVTSMTGCLYSSHIVKPGVAGRPRPTLSYDLAATGEYLEIQGLGDVFYDVSLPAGSRLDAWTFHIDKNSSPSVTLTGQLFVNSTSGAPSGVGSSAANNASAPGFISSINASGLGVRISDPLLYYFVRLDISGTFGASTDRIRALILTAWLPI